MIEIIPGEVWQIENCFDDPTLSWLRTVASDQNSVFEAAPLAGRMQLSECDNWKQIQEIGRAFEPWVASITNTQPSLTVAKYWIDDPGFSCAPHLDDVHILITLQIYLETNAEGHGVKFLPIGYEVPLQANVGYLHLNDPPKMHRVKAGDGKRVSLNIQFARQ